MKRLNDAVWGRGSCKVVQSCRDTRLEDFGEKQPSVGQSMLQADESPRQVGRRIVIRLERPAKVGRVIRFSTEPGNRAYEKVCRSG